MAVWQFQQEDEVVGFQLLAGNVHDGVWNRVLKGSPPRHFPKGIER